MKAVNVFAIAVVSSLTALPMQAQTPTKMPATGQSTMSSMAAKPPQAFVDAAAKSDMQEIDDSKLAESHASNADVKSFAQRLVNDHQKSSDELKDLAARKNWKWNGAMTPPASATGTGMATTSPKMGPASKLANLNGAAFNRAYLDGQVAAHQQAVAMFDAEAKNGTDSELKAWAETTLPTLREHLQMAKDLAAKIKK